MSDDIDKCLYYQTLNSARSFILLFYGAPSNAGLCSVDLIHFKCPSIPSYYNCIQQDIDIRSFSRVNFKFIAVLLHRELKTLSSRSTRKIYSYHELI